MLVFGVLMVCIFLLFLKLNLIDLFFKFAKQTGNCDIPMNTFTQALKQIAAKHSHEIDYVIWTGKIKLNNLFIN